MWQNIGREHHGEQMHSQGHADPTKQHANTSTITVDCHSANRGLFIGLLLVVITVITVIIFFLAFSNDEYTNVGRYVNTYSDLMLTVMMTVTVILAYRQIVKLDLITNPTAMLDTLLLFIAIPSFFLYGIFSTVPAVQLDDSLSRISIVLSAMQVSLLESF